MQKQRTMQKIRHDAKALEQEMLLRAIFVVQLEVKLERDRVEVGKTCQQARHPVSRVQR